jgi:small subunit ribosomal protein S17
METPKTVKRQFVGTVVSDKMAKTVVVRVDRTVLHPKYHKRYTRSTKLKAHDEKAEYHVGDLVTVEECRPLSRDKRWRVIGRVTNGK